MTPLLALPAGIAAARMVMRQLEAADAARHRLRDPRDADALHDFRVAVRRLRSLLRSWADDLGRAATPKLRRRLRDLAGQTGAAREAETAVAWLAAQRDGLRRRERAGLNRLLGEQRRARRTGYRQARAAVRADWDPLRHRLIERMERVAAGADTLSTRLPVVGGATADAAARALARITGPDAGAAAHQARIRLKRLRYLLEPLRPERPAATAVVDDLKAAQDAFGAWHDAHVMEVQLTETLGRVAMEQAALLTAAALAGTGPGRRDERLGLAVLIARNRVRRDTAARLVADGWLGGRARPRLQAARAVCDPVGVTPAPSPPDAAGSA